MKTTEKIGWRLAIAGMVLAFAAAVPLAVQAEEPDVWLEYVEARGDQAVDVGVVGKAGTKAEVSFRWTAERFGEISLLRRPDGRPTAVRTPDSSVRTTMRRPLTKISRFETPRF